MIINPFFYNNKENKGQSMIENQSKNKNDIIFELQKYVIENCIEYLRDDLREPLIKKIEEKICTNYFITSQSEIDRITERLISKLYGYDILQKYIDDNSISDIRVIKYNKVYIKRLGKWEKVDDEFADNEDFENYIRYIVLKNNSNINYENPIIVVSDKKYNLRIEAGILPVNIASPSLVIRIHRIDKEASLETLFLQDEMLDAKSYKIIDKIVKSGKNIILSGKGGSGKTTLLREMIKRLPDNYAITISEETAELYIENKNVIEREILQNREDSKKIDLEKLLKHSLVMSNDVLVVGELKGSETSIFLDAISTGHIGMGTVHSESAKSTINRLITLIKRDLRYSEYKEEFIRNLLANSIDYLIYMENYKVCEILGVEYDSDTREVIENLVYSKEESRGNEKSIH